jgi:hypothetical protein
MSPKAGMRFVWQNGRHGFSIQANQLELPRLADKV